jgi:hypothetical protein
MNQVGGTPQIRSAVRVRVFHEKIARADLSPYDINLLGSSVRSAHPAAAHTWSNAARIRINAGGATDQFLRVAVSSSCRLVRMP